LMAKFTAVAKNNNIKSLVAIGGWNEGSIKYSEMASTEEGREKFTGSAVAFVEKRGFDGLDLDWEYPAKRGGSAKDKENYALLLKSLSEKLHSKGYLLTVAVSADPDTIDNGYDIPSVNRYADYVSLLSFDYHTASSDNFTGLNAPLHEIPGEYGTQLNVENSINKWLDGGVPANKLVLGIPLYGRTYTLQNPDFHNLGDPIVANGTAGQFTRQPGFLAYYEICMDNNWQNVRSGDGDLIYAYNGDQWVTYDDVSAVTFKAQFVMEKGLAGMMAWAVDYEDFMNKCGAGENPLLTAATQAMRRLNTENEFTSKPEYQLQIATAQQQLQIAPAQQFF
ncbi:hypothetical protein L9F63_016170, partial [Diploptera punctata]